MSALTPEMWKADTPRMERMVNFMVDRLVLYLFDIVVLMIFWEKIEVSLSSEYNTYYLLSFSFFAVARHVDRIKR